MQDLSETSDNVHSFPVPLQNQPFIEVGLLFISESRCDDPLFGKVCNITCSSFLGSSSLSHTSLRTSITMTPVSASTKIGPDPTQASLCALLSYRALRHLRQMCSILFSPAEILVTLWILQRGKTVQMMTRSFFSLESVDISYSFIVSNISHFSLKLTEHNSDVSHWRRLPHSLRSSVNSSFASWSHLTYWLPLRLGFYWLSWRALIRPLSFSGHRPHRLVPSTTPHVTYVVHRNSFSP